MALSDFSEGCRASSTPGYLLGIPAKGYTVKADMDGGGNFTLNLTTGKPYVISLRSCEGDLAGVVGFNDNQDAQMPLDSSTQTNIGMGELSPLAGGQSQAVIIKAAMVQARYIPEYDPVKLGIVSGALNDNLGKDSDGDGMPDVAEDITADGVYLDNGTVTSPPTSGGGGTAVNFADANLDICVRNKINKPSGQITTGDVNGIADLCCYGPSYPYTLPSTCLMGSGEIQNLQGIEKMTGLQDLRFASNQIGDISPLSGLTGLQELELDSNYISDISPLSGLTGLLDLRLYNNQISNVSPLSGLTGLQTLILQKNQISDISPLSGLTGLQELRLCFNYITDCSPVSFVTTLECDGCQN